MNQTKDTQKKTSTAKKKPAKQHNPLFVVTQKGQVVQEANGFLDALVQKVGLEPALQVLQNVIKVILSQLQGIVAIQVLQDLLARLVALGQTVEEVTQVYTDKAMEKLHRLDLKKYLRPFA